MGPNLPALLRAEVACVPGVREGLSLVISHDGEGSELAQFGLILPLPLLVRVAWLIQLLGQVSEDLVHF